MTLFFSPIKSTDTKWALLADKSRFPIQPVVTVFSEKRRSENRFLGPLGEVGSLLD